MFLSMGNIMHCPSMPGYIKFMSLTALPGTDVCINQCLIQAKFLAFGKKVWPLTTLVTTEPLSSI